MKITAHHARSRPLLAALSLAAFVAATWWGASADGGRPAQPISWGATGNGVRPAGLTSCNGASLGSVGRGMVDDAQYANTGEGAQAYIVPFASYVCYDASAQNLQNTESSWVMIQDPNNGQHYIQNGYFVQQVNGNEEPRYFMQWSTGSGSTTYLWPVLTIDGSDPKGENGHWMQIVYQSNGYWDATVDGVDSYTVAGSTLGLTSGMPLYAAENQVQADQLGGNPQQMLDFQDVQFGILSGGVMSWHYSDNLQDSNIYGTNVATYMCSPMSGSECYTSPSSNDDFCLYDNASWFGPTPTPTP